jgi:chloramphenicol O-acetyltransferase type A
MPKHLDLDTWARRDLFEFFRGYQNPYFNICTRLDITQLLAMHRRLQSGSVSLAYHYFALRIANEIEPFHYRLESDRVVVHEVINGGTTVLLPNETFTYAYFNYDPDYEVFAAQAAQAIDRVRAEGGLKPTMRYDLIFFTTFPWASFTSFAHARTPGRGESIPRIAFGKFTTENDRTFLPISVEVHHALMDGLHVGRFLMRLEEVLAHPEDHLRDYSNFETPGK